MSRNVDDYIMCIDEIKRAEEFHKKQRKDKWHTGTPTEEGWYLCWVKFEKGNENAIVYYWDNHEWSIVPRFYLASNDIILAWQKIEPFKED